MGSLTSIFTLVSHSFTKPQISRWYHLEEYVRRQAYGASLFICVSWDVLSTKLLEWVSVNILHGGKDVVHARFPLTYHPPVGTIDGSEIGVHLMITDLVDNQHEDLPLVGFVRKILRQDGAETAVVIVALGVSEDNTSKV